MSPRRKRNTDRLVLALVSDIHCGHKLGLLNPETPLLDEHGVAYNPPLNTTQRYLFDLYQQHMNQMADLADGCPVILCVNGDVCQGTRYTDHLSLTRIVDQLTAATWALRLWCEHPRLRVEHIRLIVGTAAHTWEGSAEVLVSQQLAQLFPKIDVRPLYHAQLELKDQGDQVVDLAHHGPFPGGRKWLRGNAARYYLASAMLAELVDGGIPPRVYARAHYHEWLRETARVRQNGVDVVSDLVITPSYSGIDDYVRRATRSKRKIDHGLVALEFEHGLREIYPFYQELDIRTKEAI